jgi:diguanylate cyclase (GGDEF)-like protein
MPNAIRMCEAEVMNTYRSISARLRRARHDMDKAVALLACDYPRLMHARASEEVAGQIRAAQLQGARRYKHAMAFANIFNASILVASLWHTSLRSLSLIWVAIFLATVGFVAAPRHKRKLHRGPATASTNSIRRAIRNAALLGAAWGAMPVMLFSQAPEESRLIIVCLCAGMLGGGAFALASVPGAALAMIAPLAMGSILGLIAWEGSAAFLPVALTIAYCTVLVNSVFIHAFEVTARLASRVEVQRLSLRDSLTDLSNTAAMRAAIDIAALRLKSAGEACSLLCIDIDRLGDINRRLGHAVGDELLHQVAIRLRGATRDVDIAARLDGDQFAILATGLSGDATARAYANRVLAAFREPFSLPGGDATVSACVGVAIAAKGASGADDLLRNANLALFVAKRQGPGQFHVHSAKDDAGRQARDAMEADLRHALAKGHLRLNFQPFLNIARNEIVGFEALLRWTHPVRGAISPMEIISIAEERGLLEALGVWVLNEACRAAASWPMPLRVAVNVSPLQLRSPALVGQVIAALRDSGLPERLLEIEVTENALIDDHPLACHVLTTLRHAGVRLALDDFGVGYSSLNYLRRLPFDRIKIDRSFMSESSHDPDAAAIVRAIITMAKDLRLEVTAEGIETSDQLRFLQDNDCAEAQGYLIAKPMSENAVAAFIESWALRDAA